MVSFNKKYYIQFNQNIVWKLKMFSIQYHRLVHQYFCLNEPTVCIARHSIWDSGRYVRQCFSLLL